MDNEAMFLRIIEFIKHSLRKVEISNDYSFNKKGIDLLDDISRYKWNITSNKLIPKSGEQIELFCQCKDRHSG